MIPTTETPTAPGPPRYFSGMSAFDPAAYVRTHHPKTASAVAIVAYQHREGGWDVFAFEPAGVLPDAWEAHRVDEEHVFLLRVETTDEVEQAAAAVTRKLGADYEKVVGFRESEPGKRAGVNLRLQRLHKAGATGYAAQQGVDGLWELVVRRKDLPLAG